MNHQLKLEVERLRAREAERTRSETLLYEQRMPEAQRFGRVADAAAQYQHHHHQAQLPFPQQQQSVPSHLSLAGGQLMQTLQMVTAGSNNGQPYTVVYPSQYHFLAANAYQHVQQQPPDHG